MAEGIKKISENVIIENRALIVTNNSVTDNKAISTGALWADASSKSLKIKTGLNTLSYFDADKILITGSISTDLLANGCVTELKVADSAITESKIASNAITTNKIASSAVTESKISNNAITTMKIADFAITNGKLGLNAVTDEKVLDNTLTGAKLLDGTINSIKIASNAITNEKLADKAISTRNFITECVDHNALGIDSVYGSKIKDFSITSTKLADTSVLTRAIANEAVTAEKLASGCITSEKLAANSVNSINIVQSGILEKHLATDSVTTTKIKDKAITKSKLSAGVIDLIGDPVQYDSNNNVYLRKNLDVTGNVEVTGSLRANKVYNAVFMDIAEAYEPEEDTVYIPGDIVQVNENGKLIKATASSTLPTVGVISDEYAACYGATEEEITSGTKIAVGLIGKVHVNVVGPVKLGDKIAIAKDGTGASYNTNNLIADNIIGKALESNDNTDLKKVLCLIYPR